MSKTFRLVNLMGTLLISLSASTQQMWQQRVVYKMDISVDHNTHGFTGTQTIIYTNNSPDVLTHAYWHLYFNAFQPGSAMDIRSLTIEDPDPRVGERISKLQTSEYGRQHVKTLTQDGKTVLFSENETILEVILAKPIEPGGKAVFEMEFEGQVPLQVRRSGRDNVEGIDYSMSQWYPKLCEYDCNGWTPNPYVGREFYGVWGDFEVNITMDKSYMVAATGVLQNIHEIGRGYEEPGTKIKEQAGPKITWRFKAEDVHDFVWAADPDYVHEKLKVPDGPELHFFYQDDPLYAQAWKDLPSKAATAFEFMSRHFGKYPYPVYAVIQGGDGGMEYPMATLVTGNRKAPSLVGVTIHEAAHSWYHGVLGFNESLYSWMDEGFTSFMTSETISHLQVGDPKRSHDRAIQNYVTLARSGREEPLTTHADHYMTSYAYGDAAYSKGETYLCQLRYIMGDDAFTRTMISFFEKYKFKHPTDLNFIHIAELESGMVLDWFHEYFVQTTKQIDYSIIRVSGGEETEVIIERIAPMPMPLEILVTMRDGSKRMYYIPLDLQRGEKPQIIFDGKWLVQPDWIWVYPATRLNIDRSITEIASIEIDPSGMLADVDRENNKVEITEGLEFYFERVREVIKE
ncbi:MAG: M1 family metallopeptidase [Flavobacteriales bacterium]|nr:M1 family metallopeptidase [Flavobacteriales bacterium]